MRRRIGTIGLIIGVAAVVGPLGIGARAAYAAASQPSMCGPTYEGGSCIGNVDCQETCDALFPPPGSRTGTCVNTSGGMCCRCDV